MRRVRSRHGNDRGQQAVKAQPQTAGRPALRGRVQTDGTNGARTGGDTQVVGSYRDREGIRWLVVVRHPDIERWEVCEIAEHEQQRAIDELSGEGESKRTAVAVARDYLHVQRRKLTG
jgi:hypothetical protein